MGRKEPDEVIICGAIVQEQKTIAMDYPDHDFIVAHKKKRKDMPPSQGKDSDGPTMAKQISSNT